MFDLLCRFVFWASRGCVTIERRESSSFPSTYRNVARYVGEVGYFDPDTNAAWVVFTDTNGDRMAGTWSLDRLRRYNLGEYDRFVLSTGERVDGSVFEAAQAIRGDCCEYTNSARTRVAGGGM